MLTMLMIYGYYAFIPISMIATVIFDRKYEKYKRDEGYKNKYRGTYKTKGLFDERLIEKIKTIADLGGTFLCPGYQFIPLIDLALFKGQANFNLHKETACEDIECVDPNVIDGEFKIISEEKNDNDGNTLDGEKREFSMEALTMHAASQMENPDFYGEETQEYREAVEAYKELCEYYTEEMDKQKTPDLAQNDEKTELHLK